MITTRAIGKAIGRHHATAVRELKHQQKKATMRYADKKLILHVEELQNVQENGLSGADRIVQNESTVGCIKLSL